MQWCIVQKKNCAYYEYIMTEIFNIEHTFILLKCSEFAVPISISMKLGLNFAWFIIPNVYKGLRTVSISTKPVWIQTLLLHNMIVFNLKEMANTLSPTFDPTVSRFTIYVKTQVPCIMKDDWFSTLAQQRLHACKLVFIRRQIRRNRLL